MPQVILKVAMDQFYYAINFNSRRRPDIGTSCARGEDICVRTSQEFHRRNPQDSLLSKRERTVIDHNVHQRKIDNFYDKVCHVRVVAEGNDKRGGFVVLDGELLGFHHVDKGKGDWMLREAVKLGADRLDCYDIPHLIDLYERHGFREILREPNTKKGQPDVVWMRKQA